MGLLQLEASAEVLSGLDDIAGLYLIRSTVESLGAGRHRIAGYGAEALIPELEARGCTVQVVMTTAQIDQFHGRVAASIEPPEAPPEPIGDGPEA